MHGRMVLKQPPPCTPVAAEVLRRGGAHHLQHAATTGGGAVYRGAVPPSARTPITRTLITVHLAGSTTGGRGVVIDPTKAGVFEARQVP
jgi:hypothetical protein